MGALISLFNNEGSGGKSTVDVFLDFERAQPTEGKEQQLYYEVETVLNAGQTILNNLQSYRGCEEYIRAAITSPTPESEKAAWAAVVPAVNQLREFYEYSKQIEIIFPKLLKALFSDNVKDSLTTQQALARQLADVFDFVLRFDDAKMIKPGIQNDFSYYRRSLARMKAQSANKDGAEFIPEDVTNRMSLFLAYPTPMLRVLTDVTSSDRSLQMDNIIYGLSMMANICCDMVAKRKFQNTATNLFCLRAMTGCVILVDHISPTGAFSKKSQIHMKNVITVLKNFTDAPTDGMLNALRFTTVHLNDPETPASIRQLLQ